MLLQLKIWGSVKFIMVLMGVKKASAHLFCDQMVLASQRVSITVQTCGANFNAREIFLSGFCFLQDIVQRLLESRIYIFIF